MPNLRSFGDEIHKIEGIDFVVFTGMASIALWAIASMLAAAWRL